MNHFLSFFINDVYGVEKRREEKRREEKRREEKRREERTLIIHPSATAAGIPVLLQQYIIIRYRPLFLGKVAA